MNKAQKSESVLFLKKSFLDASFVVIAHYRGMSDKQLFDFRVSVKNSGAHIKIVKNTLAKLAIVGTKLEALNPYFKGPTAVLHSDDPIVLSKLIYAANKDSPSLKVVVAFANEKIINESEVESLAKLGSINNLRSSFMGVLTFAQLSFLRTIFLKVKL